METAVQHEACEVHAEPSRKLELFISRALMVGVSLSGIVIGLGLLLLLLTGEGGYPAGQYPIAPAALAAGVVALKPYAVINLGLILLVFTPIFRVAASAVAFVAERDHLYAVISLLVLVILLISLASGKVAH
ncbi:MAG TPA: DUF1634 domain-containing protein [Symbiobacteriaceae bacterium]|nr:DUF1634 domain-containing protein [Symbiobacteriaceae bacterium]